MHKATDRYGGSKFDVKAFVDLLEKYQVAAVFAGHLHYSAGKIVILVVKP